MAEATVTVVNGFEQPVNGIVMGTRPPVDVVLANHLLVPGGRYTVHVTGYPSYYVAFTPPKVWPTPIIEADATITIATEVI